MKKFVLCALLGMTMIPPYSYGLSTSEQVALGVGALSAFGSAIDHYQQSVHGRSSYRGSEGLARAVFFGLIGGSILVNLGMGTAQWISKCSKDLAISCGEKDSFARARKIAFNSGCLCLVVPLSGGLCCLGGVLFGKGAGYVTGRTVAHIADICKRVSQSV